MTIKLIKTLIEFLLKIIGQKTAEIPKAEIPKAKTPTKSKPFKQVEQIPETATPSSTIITTWFCVGEGLWHYSNGKKATSKLESGWLIDTCTQISFDDYRELREVGRKIANEFRGKPIYVISTSKYEYKDKKCPAYRQEQVLDLPFTGAPRNFDKSFAKTQKSFDADIYFVDVESYPEHQALAKELLPGSHTLDSNFLAFAKFTGSTLITLDRDLLKCCKQRLIDFINFQHFLNKIMPKNPIIILLQERRRHFKRYGDWRF